MRSIIPDLYIELPDYRLYDSPYPRHDAKDRKYMFREGIEEQLKSRLASSNRSGSILVSGYRGVGKSSMVRKSLRDLNKWYAQQGAFGSWWRSTFGTSRRRYMPIELNLAQDDLDEKAILRLMATQLLREMERMTDKPFSYIRRLLVLIHVFVVAGAIGSTFIGVHALILDDELWREWWKGLSGTWTVPYAPDGLTWFAQFGVPVLAGIGANRFMGWLLRHVWPEEMELSMSRLRGRLRYLIERIHAQVIEERTEGLAPLQPFSPFSFLRKQNRAFPLAKTKEIELELIDILDTFGKLDEHNWYERTLLFFGRRDLIESRKAENGGPHQSDYKRQFVFVVDELDKLVPRGFRSVWEKEREDPTDDDGPGATQPGLGPRGSDLYRERQEAIAGLFANLKHFLNVAKAKFVFIGGHDLRDGVLADTSDRDPFFSSIFNQVVYVPSFLKEEQSDLLDPKSEPEKREEAPNVTLGKGSIKQGEKPIWPPPAMVRVQGLTSTTERFVAEAVLRYTYVRERRTHDQFTELSTVVKSLPASFTDLERSWFLTALQNYCVYLTFRSNGITKKLVQLFEANIVQLEAEDVYRLHQMDRSSTVVIHCNPAPTGKNTPARRYLKLDANALYSHYLLSYFYRPFISLYSGYYRSLNDKHLVALTYLLDHMFKYHSTAFSFFNLQMTPETISVDKVPEFHKFMDDMLQGLGFHCLRQIDNGLFGFQFYTRIYNEIAYLSKVSELDSAAMNFSLDESLPIKQHYYRRLDHALKMERGGKGDRPGESPGVRCSLHHTLGDLHFYDAQLDEALGHYRSAAYLIEPSMQSLVKGMWGHAPTERPPRDQFNLYLKLRLKQVLCLEKMKVFESALALSSQLSKEVIAYVRQWHHMRSDDIGNWRLVILALVHRAALVEKTSRRGVKREDLGDILRFISLMRVHLQTPRSDYARMESRVSMYIGSILHFAGGSIPLAGPSSNNLHTSRHYYETCLKINLQLKRRDSLIAAKAWDSIQEACSWPNEPVAGSGSPVGSHYEKPRLVLLAESLSRYADALIAEMKDDSMTGIGGGVIVFEDILIDDLVYHPVFGEVATWLLCTARVHIAAGNKVQAVFQIKKLIFYLVERYDSDANRQFTLPAETIAQLCDWALAVLHSNQQHIDEQQITKAATSLSGAGHAINMNDRRDLASYSTDLLEVEVLRDELLLKAELITPQSVRERYGSEVRNVTLQFTRVRLLALCVRTNWSELHKDWKEWVLHYPLNASTIPPIASMAAHQELIVDSIDSCFQLIGSVSLFSSKIVGSHTLLAKANEHLADWCLLLENLPNESDRNSVKRSLRMRLGAKYESRLSSLMYYSIAKHHFEQAVHMHTRGRAYARAINDMYLLEDDYMDDLFHFCCALERMRVHDRSKRGHHARIERLQERIAFRERHR